MQSTLKTIKIGYHAGPPAVAIHGDAVPADGKRWIAFVHGLASPWTAWLVLHDHWLAPTFCSFLDMPWGTLGEGTTETWPLAVDNAALVARGLALLPRPPDILIAHSFGAAAVLEGLARGLIALPQAVVLVSPFFRPSAADFQWDTLDYYVNDFHRVLEEGLVARGNRTRPPKLENLRDMALKIRERVGACGWMHFFRAYMATPLLKVDKITVPILVIGGDRDISAFPADARALAAILPQATCRIFDSVGHFIFLEDPVLFAAELEKFLTSAKLFPHE